MTPGDLRSPQRGQRFSVGILLDIAEPDVARTARRSSPAGHWLLLDDKCTNLNKLKTLVIDWWYACAVQRSHSSDEAGADN